MKQYMMYKCEKCGLESRNRDEINLCEAKHMGLNSLEKKDEYDNLQRDVEYRGSVMHHTCNDITRKKFDNAIEAILKFEKENGMNV